MNMKPIQDAGSAMNGWFAAGKAVISQGMGRLLRPGYWSAKPPAGVDFVSAFARDDDGAWVCQPDGAGGYRWEQAGNVLAGLADPNADRILFWDDSAGAYAYLTPGTNLSITGTTLDAAGSSPLLYSNASISTAVNATATETAFDRSYTVPANDLAAGDVLRIHAWGTNGTHSAGTVTIQFRLRWGGVAGVILGVLVPLDTLVVSESYKWQLSSRLLFTAVGAAGVVEGAGRYAITTVSPGGLASDQAWDPASAAIAVDTTVNKDLVITVQHGASNAANTATLRGITVERLRV